MNIEIGLAYTVSNSYFERFASEQRLLKNHGSDRWGAGARPYLVVGRDSSDRRIFWAVPLSSQTAKYADVQDRKVARYGYCDTIHLGEFGNKKTAFLIQNMCPVSVEYFVDRCDTRAGKPIVPYRKDSERAQRLARRVLEKSERGMNRLIFADYRKIYAELRADHALDKSAASLRNQPTKDALGDARRRANERNRNREGRSAPSPPSLG